LEHQFILTRIYIIFVSVNLFYSSIQLSCYECLFNKLAFRNLVVYESTSCCPSLPMMVMMMMMMMVLMMW